MFIRLHIFSATPVFSVVFLSFFFFLAFVFSACEIPKYGTETCRYVRDLETASKLGKSVYVSLEFRTWGRKSMLSVPYESAEACCPVNAQADGCSFDGLQ
jgi:hypothetical protein